MILFFSVATAEMFSTDKKDIDVGLIEMVYHMMPGCLAYSTQRKAFDPLARLCVVLVYKESFA